MTRKIAEELDSLSGREDRSTTLDHPQPVEDSEPSLSATEEPAAGPAASEAAGPVIEDDESQTANARSLREVLSWRRLKIN